MNDEARRKVRERVLSVIPWGRENAIIADRICELARTEVEWRTQLPTRDMIRELRGMGHPICSCSGGKRPGYWRTKIKTELLETVEQLNSRARSIQHVADCLHEASQRIG